jgi:thioesterase domain-containing protein
MNSLRVLDVVSGLRRVTGIRCAPTDFISHPTVGRFAAYLATQQALQEQQNIQRETPQGRDEHNAPLQLRPALREPLLTLNRSGHQPPLVCMHPAGGHVTAYLRLRQALGDASPLFVVQSRALDEPGWEHADIESMAIDYATLVQTISTDQPYRLLGWSMGGLVAHAVASELERRGASVALVGMIDPSGVGRRSNTVSRDVLRALTAVIHELQPSHPQSDALLVTLQSMNLHSRAYSDILCECEEKGLIPNGVLSPADFGAAIQLYLSHFKLCRQFRPKSVIAPIMIWRATSAGPRYDWSKHGRHAVADKLVGGNHFSIMRPPYIDAIASDLSHQSA